MEYKKFSFDPEAGYLDTSFYEDTPSNPREILQRQHNQTRDYINSVIDTLNSKTEGSSGSESIKSPEIEGVTGDNVYEQIKDIKRQINEAAEAVIPDSSVTRAKLQDGAVTNSKIADGEIKTEKFNEDAVAPFANEPLNINGESACLYTPLNKTGFCGALKELVYKGSLKSISGKTKYGKRYMIMDNLLYTLDLETGELEAFGSQTVPLNAKLAVYSEDIVYLAVLANESDNYTYFTIYKYEKEYDEIITVTKLKAFSTQSYSPTFCGIDVSDTHFFMGVSFHGNPYKNNSYYKIPLEELLTITEAEIYYSYNTYTYPDDIIYSDGDVYFGTRIFKDTLTEEIKELTGDIKCCDSYGNILINSRSLPLWKRDTLLPLWGNPYQYTYTNDFIYNNYYYSLIDGYLFKARIS